MIIEYPDTEKYRILLDGEEFDTKRRIIYKVDTVKGRITFIYKMDCFPYWPSVDVGEVTLEKLNG